MTIVLDANYILRYLLNDNETMFNEAKDVIESQYCLLLNEVLAEVVYVLLGVYKVPKEEIATTLSNLLTLDNLTTVDEKTYLLKALKIYESKNLDYIDCYLCALSDQFLIKTFDKKLKKCINLSVKTA